MTMTARRSGSTVSYLAALAAAAMIWSLLPLAGTASAQEEDDALSDACPVEAEESQFRDRDDIPDAHVRNVDCAAFLGIVAGFTDGTYRPRAQVRRDQMASFIARTLDKAQVALPLASDAEGFDDVAGNEHRDSILRLQEAGIVAGGPGSLGAESYGPALRTRRDQMASFIVRAAAYAFFDDVDALDEDEAQFDDVPASNAHFEKVNAASVNGFAQGVDGSRFLPGRHTTRDQMAAFVVRLLNFLAVPAQVTVDSPETGTVLETVTATATVTDQFGNPLADETVTVQAQHETDTALVLPPGGTETTDADGEATFDFTTTQEGEVTVTASIEEPGANFAVQSSDLTTTEFEGGDVPSLGQEVLPGIPLPELPLAGSSP